nr:hypothetical protein GCM10025732_16710 [Glycomyces mayteni]
MMDIARLDALRDEVLDFRHKGVPAAAYGLTVGEWIASGPPPPPSPPPRIDIGPGA